MKISGIGSRLKGLAPSVATAGASENLGVEGVRVVLGRALEPAEAVPREVETGEALVADESLGDFGGSVPTQAVPRDVERPQQAAGCCQRLRKHAAGVLARIVGGNVERLQPARRRKQALRERVSPPPRQQEFFTSLLDPEFFDSKPDHNPPTIKK